MAITKKQVATAGPGWHAVGDVPGLALLVRNGQRRWVFDFRNAAGKQRRLTLGRGEVMTPDEAVRAARAHRVAVDSGRDPLAERETARRAQATNVTVEAFATRYLEQHAAPRKKRTSVMNDRVLLDNYVLPALRRMPMNEVTRADIIKLHHSMSNVPTYANRMLALCSKMFSLAEAWGVRRDGSNPCRHVARNKEQRRERFLSGAELAKLGEVLDQVEREADAPPTDDENAPHREHPSVAPAIRLLLATGARLSEVLGLKWSWVRLDERRIDLPDSKVGSRSLVLNTVAIGVLDELARRRDPEHPYVLPGLRKGQPFVGLGHAWARVRERAKLGDCRLHDLRHTHASLGVAQNQSLLIVGKLLGHKQVTTAGRYAHLHADPLLEASEQIGQALTRAMKKSPPATTPVPVPMERRTRRRRRG